MRQIVTFFLVLISSLVFAQKNQRLDCNKDYSDIKIDNSVDLNYKILLKKGCGYKISVLQQGIDVVVYLLDNANKQIVEKDSPIGQNGYERFNYFPNKTGDYNLIIKRLDELGNPLDGKVSIDIMKYSDLDYNKVKELDIENNKTVQTLDILHFWDTYDNLKGCRNHSDSVKTFQKYYIDRATTSLTEYLSERGFTAEDYVKVVSLYPKFYNSVRRNTLEVIKVVPIIDSIFSRFKEIYPSFKPCKVCFSIGVLRNSGRAFGDFVYIGSEVSASTKDVDLSEFNNNALSKVLASSDNISQKIKNIVSHECVHTQQKTPIDTTAIGCDLLYNVMREGFCDFIGELISGGIINKVAQEYGNNHEGELWREFKNELCNNNSDNWLSNYATVKNKPADLGYYIGYKIAKEYYQNAKDKKQAIIDIIEMNNPIKFLALSKYDKKEKK